MPPPDTKSAKEPTAENGKAGEPRARSGSYFALVLSEASQRLLREKYATLSKPRCHHCTVRYGCSDPADLPPAFRPANLGERFELKVIGLATRKDGGVQAAVVALVALGGELFEQGFSTNRVPHITLATDEQTEPREANTLLEEGFERIDGPILQATLLHIDENGN